MVRAYFYRYAIYFLDVRSYRFLLPQRFQHYNVTLVGQLCSANVVQQGQSHYGKRNTNRFIIKKVTVVKQSAINPKTINNHCAFLFCQINRSVCLPLPAILFESVFSRNSIDALFYFYAQNKHGIDS